MESDESGAGVELGMELGMEWGMEVEVDGMEWGGFAGGCWC